MSNHNPNPTDEPIYERAMLVQTGMDGTTTRKALQAAHHALSAIPANAFQTANLKEAIASQTGGSNAAPDALPNALRVALTGRAQPIDIYDTMALLGKDRTLRRLNHAIQQLMVIA